MKRIGIDEAGRGPVLGPLVVTGIQIPLQDHSKLLQKGVKDSKKIPKHKHRALADYLQKKYASHTVFVSATQIDQHLKKGISLNRVEEKAMKKILQTFSSENVMIDSPVKNTEKWENRFNQQVQAETKADLNHVDVAAASIIAKHKRDTYMKTVLGEEAGSGYPSDPKTKNFLQNVSMKHKELRKTWQTTKNIVEERTQQKLRLYKYR